MQYQVQIDVHEGMIYDQIFCLFLDLVSQDFFCMLKILFFFRLALGCISPRKIYHEIKRYEKERTANQSTYWVIFELLWRDYFRFVALKFGNRLFYLSGIQGKHIAWKTDRQLFAAWKGYYMYLEWILL